MKTDNLFRNIKVKFDLFSFDFDASTLENKQATTKKELNFSLVDVVKDEIKIKVSWQEGNKKSDAKGIAKELLKQHNIKASVEELDKAFWYFKQQTKCDFFINKNAKAFLQEQFKIWCANYLWENDGYWPTERINEIQNLKSIAFKLIDFFSHFEDELVSIWNKPKFARNSNYVISADRIDENMLKKIKAHKGYEAQLKEWRELEIDENATTAPIDTKFFKDLELEIISQFGCLDDALDGRLIKSENYQALKTISPKFKSRVQCIYIDPPFNLGVNARYDYEVNYKDASWATLLENRITLAREMVREQGGMFVRCDYNGNWIVKKIMDSIFDHRNFRNEIDIKRNQSLPKTGDVNLVEETENLMVYSKGLDFIFREQLVTRKDPYWGPLGTRPSDKKENPSRTVEKHKFYPPPYRRWSYSQKNLDEMYENERLKVEDGKIMVYIDKRRIGTNWTDIIGYSTSPEWGLATENSEKLLERVIRMSSKPDDLVMDFFLGSGTTVAVAHKMGRKWIGVEVGEHFDTVVLPRMKKVLAYDKTGISKKTPEYKGGGFFKYYELEQYGETLAKCRMAEMGDDLITHTNKSDYEQYVFLTNTKLTECVEADLEKKKYKIDLSKLYDNIDVAETISNKTGRWIKSISKDKVEFTDGHSINIKNLDYREVKELIWWERPKR